MERTHTGAVLEELQPAGRTHIGELHGELSPVRGTFTLEPGQSVRNPPLKEDGAVETTCDELTTTPIPVPLHRSGGGGREMGVKLSLGTREGWGEGVLRPSFISHYPTLI